MLFVLLGFISLVKNSIPILHSFYGNMIYFPRISCNQKKKKKERKNCLFTEKLNLLS